MGGDSAEGDGGGEMSICDSVRFDAELVGDGDESSSSP